MMNFFQYLIDANWQMMMNLFRYLIDNWQMIMVVIIILIAVYMVLCVLSGGYVFKSKERIRQETIEKIKKKEEQTS